MKKTIKTCFLNKNYSVIQNKTLKVIFNQIQHVLTYLKKDLLLTPLFLVTHEFKSLGKKTEDGHEPKKLAVWVHVHVHDRKIVKHFGWKCPHLYLGYISVFNYWFCFSSDVTEMLILLQVWGI